MKQKIAQKPRNCSNCLPECSTERPSNRNVALIRFQLLFSLQLSPIMCQQNDSDIYLCYRELAATVSAPVPERRPQAPA